MAYTVLWLMSSCLTATSEDLIRSWHFRTAEVTEPRPDPQKTRTLCYRQNLASSEGSASDMHRALSHIHTEVATQLRERLKEACFLK